MEERRQALVDMGLAIRQPDGSVTAPRDILDRLRRQELERVPMDKLDDLIAMRLAAPNGIVSQNP